MSISAKKSAQAKSVCATQKKSAARKCAKPAEEEDDEFDRAISRAAKAGAFDEMIAQALQDKRDGKTKPLSYHYRKTGSG